MGANLETSKSRFKIGCRGNGAAPALSRVKISRFLEGLAQPRRTPGKAHPCRKEQWRGPGTRGPPPVVSPHDRRWVGAPEDQFTLPKRDGSPTPRAPGTATPSARSGTHRLGAHGSPCSPGAVPKAQARTAQPTTTPGRTQATQPGAWAHKMLTWRRWAFLGPHQASSRF